ncbi:nagb/rpia/CoA transferase-like protein [Auriscalpium vulgare]|uniref:Nagb/rpia/CoA transferase-like protein n=1 Tax=Auriscalpium vulgare TaxID=40419 RepID=A0ACB8RXE9_9AGAM|nr:nagb/rpia/CoA transferase-like protein [Auriscalpium vulgare]
MATVQAHKRALRKAVAIRTKSLSPTDVESQSRQIADRVLSSPWFQRSRTVSCYLSMPTGEVDTAPLVHEILRLGKALFVPKIDVSTAGRMDLLRVYGEEDLASMPSGVWGIKEPTTHWREGPRAGAMDDSNDLLDLILVPGVAFDPSLARLGHGKGYYDRYITSYAAHAASKSAPRPLLVALSLREQLLESGAVPMSEHDWKMDFIVGPDGTLGNVGDEAIH